MTKLLALLVTFLFLVSHVHSKDLVCGPLPSDNEVNYRKKPVKNPTPDYRGVHHINAKTVVGTSKYNHLIGASYPNSTHPIIFEFKGKTLSSLSMDYVACGRPGGHVVLEIRDEHKNVIHKTERNPYEWCGEKGETLNKLEAERTIEAQDFHGKIKYAYVYYIGAGTRCHAKACWEALAIRELRYNCAHY